MMEGQARSSGLVMGLDNPHDRREPCLFSIKLGALTRPSPPRQTRTMPRPWRMTTMSHGGPSGPWRPSDPIGGSQLPPVSPAAAVA